LWPIAAATNVGQLVSPEFGESVRVSAGTNSLLWRQSQHPQLSQSFYACNPSHPSLHAPPQYHGSLHLRLTSQNGSTKSRCALYAVGWRTTRQAEPAGSRACAELTPPPPFMTSSALCNLPNPNQTGPRFDLTHPSISIVEAIILGEHSSCLLRSYLAHAHPISGEGGDGVERGRGRGRDGRGFSEGY
jgi:hypothetical protein